jgi:hypothetical protein
MQPTALFDRLPPTIFRPLAATNNRRYWLVLCRLFEQLWGDGGNAPGEDIDKSRVIRVVESHLIQDDPWLDDGGQPLESPASVRAHDIYETFKEAGWLAERRRGMRTVVTVRPVVAQFFDALVEFAERGPQFLGSRIRSILASLRFVTTGEADGGQFMEAARQAHSLWTHIANTGVQVYDLMERLQKVGTTREFVEGFFEEYIEKIFIGDYLDIRTANHPLQNRSEIIGQTLQCAHSDQLSESILQWYCQKLAEGDQDKARRLFDRDIGRLMRLQNVEQHLQRLDTEIRSANQRAITYLEYKIRAPLVLDQLLARACQGVVALSDDHIALPEGPLAEPLGPEWLAPPPKPNPAHHGSVITHAPPSIEALALDALRKRMIDARLVTPIKLATYAARHLGDHQQVASDDLTIDTILDLACYQRLLLIASRSDAPPHFIRSDPFVLMVPGMSVRFVGTDQTRNDFISHRRFVIYRERRH